MKVSRYTIPLKLEEDEYLLINSRTGAVNLVDTDVMNLLQNELCEADPSVIQVLKESGHLTELLPEEEVGEIEQVYKKYVQTHRRVHRHMILPAYDCNVQSRCFSHIQSSKVHMDKIIDNDYIDAIFEAAAHIDGDYKGRMILHGGSLVNTSTIEAILSRGTCNGYTFLVTTGGAVLDFVNSINILKKYSAALEVTTDGLNYSRSVRNGSAIDEGVQGIDAALDAEVPVFLRINLDHNNLSDLPRMIHFFKKKGWYDHPTITIYFSPVFQDVCRRNEPFTLRKMFYQEIITQMATNPEIPEDLFTVRGIEMFGNVFLKGVLGPPRFWYCEANSGVFIYDPFGDIYVCTEHVGEESTRVGTYYPELTWNCNLKAWRERLVFTIEECRKCTYALFCGGGCGYEAVTQYGTLSACVCYNYSDMLTKAIPHLYKAVTREL